MAKADYYETLGVSRGAADDELKKAYRRKAMKFHPDRNQDDKEAETKFKAAKEAFEVLSNPQKRSAYDQFGHAGVDQSAGMGGGGQGAAGFGDVFGDIFGDIFGGGGRQAGGRRNRGSDLRIVVELTLEEAVNGVEKTIKVPKLIDCKPCKGSGSKPGTSPVNCGTCHGQGQVRMQQGFFTVQQTCPQCRGQGKVINDPCVTCRGEGRVRDEKNLAVKIPPGIDDGDQVRLSGEGESGGAGGVAGDLYVQSKIKPHAIFEREGDNLFCEVPISYATMALGGSLDIPTLSGKASIKVPAGSQSGKTFRLRGKGVANVRGGNPGDLLSKLVIETPVNMTREQKEMLETLDQSIRAGGNSHSPRSSSWTDKIKSLFDGFVS